MEKQVQGAFCKNFVDLCSSTLPGTAPCSPRRRCRGRRSPCSSPSRSWPLTALLSPVTSALRPGHRDTSRTLPCSPSPCSPRCRALLIVNAVAPSLLAEEEKIRSTLPSAPSPPHSFPPLSPSLIFFHEPEPRPKLPTRLAGDRELPIQIPDHQHLRRALFPLSARGIV